MLKLNSSFNVNSTFKSTAAATLGLAACLFLSACASTVAPGADIQVGAYRQALELNGRLSVNYNKDGKAESLSGKFNWVQTPEAVNVALSSPLGQTIATITVSAHEAVLVQSDQAPRRAPDIDTLTAEALGWSLPVAGLRDWLQGYATAADGQRFAASPASNSVTTKDGWRLTFVSWQNGTGQPRPKRIDAVRPVDELALRIVIDQG